MEKCRHAPAPENRMHSLISKIYHTSVTLFRIFFYLLTLFLILQLTFGSMIAVDETLRYESHPDDASKTKLSQEAVVTVQGIPLCSYVENLLTSKISHNANKVNMFPTVQSLTETHQVAFRKNLSWESFRMKQVVNFLLIKIQCQENIF